MKCEHDFITDKKGFKFCRKCQVLQDAVDYFDRLNNEQKAEHDLRSKYKWSFLGK